MAIANPIELNTTDKLAVRKVIVERCAGHVANYALYIIGGGANSDPNVANMKQWASNAILNAATIGDQVSWHVLNQTSFKNGGSSIEDDELKGIVETAINNNYITPAS